jgi:hypothetical protein
MGQRLEWANCSADRFDLIGWINRRPLVGGAVAESAVLSEPEDQGQYDC